MGQDGARRLAGASCAILHRAIQLRSVIQRFGAHLTNCTVSVTATIRHWLLFGPLEDIVMAHLRQHENAGTLPKECPALKCFC